MKVKFIICLLVSLVAIGSCKKKSNNDNGTPAAVICDVTKYIVNGSSSLVSYDAQSRVVSILSDSAKMYYTYGNKQTIINNREITSTGDSNHYILTLNFDANNLLKSGSIDLVSQGIPVNVALGFTLTSDGYVSKMRQTISVLGQVQIRDIDYYYDQVGNMIKDVSYDVSDPTTTTTTDFTYYLDKKDNLASFRQNSFSFSSTGSPGKQGPNVLKSSKDEDTGETVNYTYTFDSDGKITSSTTVNTSTSETNTVNYNYTCH